MFLLPRAINRGDLRSTGISRFIAKPLRLYRFPSLASASSGMTPFMLPYHTWLLSLRSGMFHQEPLCFSDARLVTSLSISSSMLSATPGCRLPLVYSVTAVSPATSCKGSALSQNFCFLGAMVRIQGMHPSPRLTRLPLVVS